MCHLERGGHAELVGGLEDRASAVFHDIMPRLSAAAASLGDVETCRIVTDQGGNGGAAGIGIGCCGLRRACAAPINHTCDI